MSDEMFLKVPLSILNISKLRKEGKHVPFTLGDKIVYSYFLMKIRYFCWENGGEYFDKQEDISRGLGTDVQVVRRSISKLIDCGILKGRKKMYQGRMKWVYYDILTPNQISTPFVTPSEQDIDIPDVLR